MQLKKIKIKSIRRGSIQPLFDIQVPNQHHFFANGILSSNCKKFPIQTQPREKEIRSIICAPPGWYLVEFDLSQIELRLAAWYSQDPTMLHEFKHNVDIHRETTIFRLLQSGYIKNREDIDKLEKEFYTKQRKRSKLYNFGGLYEGGCETIMHSMNEKLEEGEDRVSKASVEAHLNFFFNKYSSLKTYYKMVRDTAQRDKKVVSCFGRVRKLPALNLPDIKENRKNRSEAFRQAVNSLGQGSGSDITQFAFIECDEWLRKHNKKSIMSFTVHDALFGLVPENEVYDFCKIAKERMEAERPPILRDNLMIKAEGAIYTHWKEPINDETLNKLKITKEMLEG